MTNAAAATVAGELNDMRVARRELGGADCYLSTEEAVNFCPLDISGEMLVGYPAWICPRLRKDPRSPRSPYLWDPRDILALPIVLRQWMDARQDDEDQDFRRRRRQLLEERDREALNRANGEDP